MDNCFVDVTIEFLAVAFHSILYYASVYPKNIFEPRKKYNVVAYRSTHPEVNQYIDSCLKSTAECLKSGKLKRIEFVVTDHKYEPKIKFVFDIVKNDCFDPTNDPYLVQTEQNLRAFCLNLSNVSTKLEAVEDASFLIHLHTTESIAVAISTRPDFEDFPLVEVQTEDLGESNTILPMRRFIIRDHSLDSYIEFNC